MSESKSQYNEKKKEYILNYAKKNLKRVPLDLQLEFYADIKAAADAAGESVNGYIKKSVQMRIESEKIQ